MHDVDLIKINVILNNICLTLLSEVTYEGTNPFIYL